MLECGSCKLWCALYCMLAFCATSCLGGRARQAGRYSSWNRPEGPHFAQAAGMATVTAALVAYPPIPVEHQDIIGSEATQPTTFLNNAPPYSSALSIAPMSNVYSLGVAPHSPVLQIMFLSLVAVHSPDRFTHVVGYHHHFVDSSTALIYSFRFPYIHFPDPSFHVLSIPSRAGLRSRDCLFFALRVSPRVASCRVVVSFRTLTFHLRICFG